MPMTISRKAQENVTTPNTGGGASTTLGFIAEC